MGGTKIQTVILRDDEVVGSERVPTPQTGESGDVIEAIVGTIHASLEQASADQADLGGVGIGSPGKIDAAAGVVGRLRHCAVEAHPGEGATAKPPR